ncbi:MAG TPA: hypothetical protein VFT22_27720 [Kofleriaceae bacterium]|nr:hypothetical protein [Kofleriaceae bacterium]
MPTPQTWIPAAAADLPVGTPVLVKRDNGTILETVTATEPWELDRVIVVLVDGIRGGYALSKVFVRQP